MHRGSRCLTGLGHLTVTVEVLAEVDGRVAAARSHVAIVERSGDEGNANGFLTVYTPWLWVYHPVRTEARAGQQIGCGENAFANLTPWSPMRRRVCGMNRRSSLRMSSTMMNTTFGLACAATPLTVALCPEGAADAADNAPQRRTTTPAGHSHLPSYVRSPWP